MQFEFQDLVVIAFSFTKTDYIDIAIIEKRCKKILIYNSIEAVHVPASDFDCGVGEVRIGRS